MDSIIKELEQVSKRQKTCSSKNIASIDSLIGALTECRDKIRGMQALFDSLRPVCIERY